MSKLTYRKVSIDKYEQLAAWAEKNNVEIDIYNMFDLLDGSQVVELGMEKWPEEK